MKVDVYFSNVGLDDCVKDLETIRSHLKKVAEKNTEGVDLRSITVKGDLSSKKIIGYSIIDYALKDKETYIQKKDFFISTDQLM